MESEEDEGSTFYVELTFEKESSLQESKAVTETADSSTSLPGIKVLQAEDNLVNQKVMFHFLDRLNADLKVVAKDEEVVEAI